MTRTEHAEPRSPGPRIPQPLADRLRDHRHRLVKSRNNAHLVDIARGLVLDFMSAKGLHTAFTGPSEGDAFIRDTLRSVVVAPEQLVIELDPARLALRERAPSEPPDGRLPHCVFVPAVEERADAVVLTLNIQIKKLDGRRLLIAPDGQDLLARTTCSSVPVPDPTIVRAIGLAYAALRAITGEGASVPATAQRLGISLSMLKYLLLLTRLGPAILGAALDGSLPPRTTVRRLVAIAGHLDWEAQIRALQRR